MLGGSVASGANRAPGASAAKPTSLRNDSTTRAFFAGASARSAMSLTDDEHRIVIVGLGRRDLAAGHVDERLGDRARLLRRRIAAAEEEALDALVLGLVEQHAVGGHAVAAGAAGLLVVALERAREVVVDDEAQVLLVDAEAERVGRDHQARLAVLHERALHALAILRAHAAVVAPALDALRPQEVGERVDGLHRRGVDDAAARLLLDQAQQQRLLLALARRLDDVVAQVRAIEPDVDHRRLGDLELREDVVLDLRRRGRGQREHRRLAERAHRLAEPEVRGAEVVPPLRDAVRLVDHEQRDAHASRAARGTAARRAARA